MGIPSPSFFSSGGSADLILLAAQSTAPSGFPHDMGRMLMMLSLDFFLVGVLLGAAFLVLSLGLLSRRREDRVGRSAPSDLEALKPALFPEEAGNPEARIAAMEEHSAGGIAQRVVGRIGESIRHSLERVEGGTSGSEAREAGGIGSTGRSTTPPEERRRRAKKAS